MSWQHHFNRARQSLGPVAVDKQSVGPLPPGLEPLGLTLNDIWEVYERQRSGEKIRITELLTQYRVSVSNDSLDATGPPQPQTTNNHPGNLLKELAGLGLIASAAAIGKALSGSPSSTTPDPKHSHQVFISHPWACEDHSQEVKSVLNNAPGFDYFNHSVSSDDLIDAQLPSHLRKKIRN